MKFLARLNVTVLALTASLCTPVLRAEVHSSLMRCEMPPALKQEFDLAFPTARYDFPTSKERIAEQEHIDKLAKREASDVAVQLAAYAAWQRGGIMSADMIRQETESLAKSKPDDAAAQYIHAMQYRASPLTMLTHLRRASEIAPDSPVIAQAFAGLYSRQPLFDGTKLREAVGAVLSKCPDSVGIYSAYLNVSDKSIASAAAKAFRTKLAATQIKPNDCAAYQTLWNLEFRSTEPQQHGTLRKTVNEDLSRLRAKFAKELSCMQTVKAGYELTGDNDGVQATAEAILAGFPNSGPAVETRMMRWYGSYMPPAQNSPLAEKQRYAERQYEFAQTELKVAPRNFALLRMRLEAALEIKSLPDAEYNRAIDEFFDIFSGSTIPLFSAPSIYLKVADAQLRRNISNVAIWVDRGEQDESRRRNVIMANAGGNAFLRRDLEVSELFDTTYAKIVLAQTFLFKNETSTARTAINAARLAIRNFKELATDQPRAKSLIAQSDARVSRWEGEIALRETKIDEAIAHFESAKKKWPADADQEFAAELEVRLNSSRLSKDGQSRPEKATDSRKSANNKNAKRVPEFAMTALDGEKLSNTSLEGSRVIINFWATWCGPCLQELPQVQKLHEMARRRPGTRVITVNADSNPGVVEPFMRRNGYDFTVLTANGAIGTPFGNLLGLPITWLILEDGRITLEKSGFSARHDDFLKEGIAFLF